MKNKYILAVLLSMMLSSCALYSDDNGGAVANDAPQSLEQLQRLSTTEPSHSHHRPEEVSQIRIDALKDVAMSVGARSGLAQRSIEINHMLTQREQLLNKTFNFYPLLLNDHVLPPVLVEAQDTLNLDSPLTIRLADKYYKIQSQARFVTAPPVWRDYLWLDYKKPEAPDKTLLPKNSQEKRIWQEYVKKGWVQGIQQANNIFDENMARLKRDYQGMILYRKLYAQNMVSAPFVAKTDLGVTGNDSHMYIGDKVLRITALSKLNIKTRTWKPAIGFPDEAIVPSDNQTTTEKSVIITDKGGSVSK